VIVVSTFLSTVHTRTSLDLPLHLLKLLMHLQQIIPLRLRRRRLRLSQLPVQILVLLVILLEPLAQLDGLAETEARY